MALLDLKSSLSTFVHSTSRSPRIVHPFLWDATHFEALGITDAAVSFDTIEANNDRINSNFARRKLFADDEVSRRRFTAFTSEVAHVHSELSSGNGSIAAGFLLHYLRSWTRGEGCRSIFVPDAPAPEGGRWDLEARDAVYNHTPIQRFACYGWQTYLQTDDIIVLSREGSSPAEQSRSPPVMATATATNMYWYWETYVDRKEKQKEAIFRRLRRDVEKSREERRRVLPRNIGDLEPIIIAILIGMAQEQRAVFPGRGVYSCHFAYPFADEFSKDAAVSTVFISARFSDSYLKTLEFDPRAASPQSESIIHRSPTSGSPPSNFTRSPTAQSSPPASRSPSQPPTDLIDVRVRIFKDVISRSSSLEFANSSCKNLLMFVGGAVARTIEELVTLRHPNIRVPSVGTVIPILRPENEAQGPSSKKRRAFERVDASSCNDYHVQEKMSLKRMCT